MRVGKAVGSSLTLIFITLLLAFFVVMYSISSVNDGKFRVLSDSMSTGFNEPIPHPLPIDLGGGAILREPDAINVIESGRQFASSKLLEDAALDELTLNESAAGGGDPSIDADFDGIIKRRLEARLNALSEHEDIQVNESDQWLTIELDSEVLFGSGNAHLSTAAHPILAEMVSTVGDLDVPIRIEGFTDNVPISGGRYGSNWQLSAARAATVAEHFTRIGIQPERLSAVGFGEYQPIADNTTAEGRRENRRVVIAIAKHSGSDAGGPVAAPQMLHQADEEQVPLRTLQRITQLPGAEGII